MKNYIHCYFKGEPTNTLIPVNWLTYTFGFINKYASFNAIDTKVQQSLFGEILIFESEEISTLESFAI